MSFCDACRGACCEDLILSLGGLSDEQRQFLEFRGTARRVRGDSGDEVMAIVLNHRCQHLTTDGRCNAYDERPAACRAFEEGGESCLARMRRRRPGLLTGLGLAAFVEREKGK